MKNKKIIGKQYDDSIMLKDKIKDNSKEIKNNSQNKVLNNIQKATMNNNNKNNSNCNDSIITFLRIRPETEEEKNYSNINMIKVESSTTLKLISPIEYNSFIEGTKFLNNEKGIEVTQTKEYIFKFDYIFDQNSQQNIVYQYSTSFLVSNIFEGFNSTIFAYGCTGAGKTYTMFGTGDKPGIIIRAINQILNSMENKGINSLYDLQMSYFEIYNENIYDLLSAEDKNNNKKKKIAEGSPSNMDEDLIKFNNKKNNNNKFFLMGITKKIIKSEQEAYEILSKANKNRSKGITSHNINSTRSHCIIQINLINKTLNIKNNIDLNDIEDKERTKFGKFILVDLAGSEKVAEIKPNTDNFYINKSLFTLTNCINGLINNKNSFYIPWRDSKLTRILKDSLLGNSKIVMIANISPSLMVIDDTFNTLNFAKRIKLVKTNAQKNIGNEVLHIDKFDSIIQNLKDQISIVKNEIKQQEQEDSIIYNNEEKNENEDIVNYENNEEKWNEILQEYINKITNHFQKEININKKINEVELKISNIKNENYFNELNNNVNKNNIKKQANELNDLQLTITSLYNKKYELTRKRRDIQVLISQETKKDINKSNTTGIGPYLMYVYKYYINLINQLQYTNRKYKIDNDLTRKDNQIQTLFTQIKLRDNVLKDIKQKTGNNNISYNKKRIIDIEELIEDPCVDINSIERNNNLEEFANSIITANNKQSMKRNISMPILRNQANILNSYNSRPEKNNNNANNNSLPIIIQKINNYNKSNNNNTINSSSLVKKRIPSGYLLRNQNSRLNNLKSIGQYKKYYNLYHISNNYHVGNFNAGNPAYNKQKYFNNNFKNGNNYSSLDFESDYNSKVKTLLKKNYIFRFKNSPYSLDNI